MAFDRGAILRRLYEGARGYARVNIKARVARGVIGTVMTVAREATRSRDDDGPTSIRQSWETLQRSRPRSRRSMTSLIRGERVTRASPRVARDRESDERVFDKIYLTTLRRVRIYIYTFDNLAKRFRFRGCSRGGEKRHSRFARVASSSRSRLTRRLSVNYMKKYDEESERALAIRARAFT